jgi:hypothetical protein
MFRNRCEPYFVPCGRCRENPRPSSFTERRNAGGAAIAPPRATGPDSAATRTEAPCEPAGGTSLAVRTDMGSVARSPSRQWCNYHI